MPASARRWTVQEVRAMQDEERAWPRYELIDGELIVTPSPRMLHQAAVMEIVLLLQPYVRRMRVGTLLTSPADIELVADTIVQPDVFVFPFVDGKRAREWPEVKSLLLAVEVLSPSTSRVDRVTKRNFFANVGVDEYWVIDVDARIVERSVAHDPRPEILDETLTWHPAGAVEPLVVDLGDFFRTVYEEGP